MPQVGTDSRPVILKNKKRGNRKLISAGTRMTAQESQTYKKNWDRIFNKSQKNYNRQNG